MGVMGGYVDRVRVGGTITLKPFSLVGLSETFALRLAAVSHSCGMVVSKNSKSVELVLMERSRKYRKMESEDSGDKGVGRHSPHYVLSLAGGTPIRSVKMSPFDVTPTPDVFVPPSFFFDGIINDCFLFLGKVLSSFFSKEHSRHWRAKREERRMIFLSICMIRTTRN